MFRCCRTTVAAIAAITVAVIDPMAHHAAGAEPKAPYRARSAPSTQTTDAPALPYATQLPQAILRPPTVSPMEVKPVDRALRPKVAEAAAAIDKILAAGHARSGVKRGVPMDDAQFVRRAWLELGGRIPTAAEATTLIRSSAPDKRAELIDSILESPDWVSRFYNVWADTLRLTERPPGRGLVFDPYLDWVKRSIAANRPYDAWVHEMLTADGRQWENPAVGYQLRDQGMPLPYIDNTFRVFLGTQIGCAQCHDHPFESWTQHQFYELAAFTAGTRSGWEGSRRLPDGSREPPDTVLQNFNELTIKLNARVKESERDGKSFEGGQYAGFIWYCRTRVDFRPMDLTLPPDYKYSDAHPGDTIVPRVPWGEVPPEASQLDSRAQFAAWLTSRENRQFARTIANRMWKLCFGAGIVDPIDDFRDENPPSHPELLEHLTDLILSLDFDIREFVRIVVSTDAWQSQAVSYDPTAGTPFTFTAPVLRRLSAEQLWDSIITLVNRDRWAYQRPPFEAFAPLDGFDMYAEHVDLDTGYACYERFRDTVEITTLRNRLFALCGYMDISLARASELPKQPLGHLLAQFGQSDRDTIDGHKTVATVPQILAMFHGNITSAELDEGSAIFQTILANDPKRSIDIIFLAILARFPDDEERRFVTGVIQRSPRLIDGYRDVIWALLNTREFLFIQ